MPASLRQRLALVALLGVFLIPIGTSSLRGLTHLLTCQEAAQVPFSVQLSENGEASMASSSVIERGVDPTLCGGLTLDLAASGGTDGLVTMTVPITNATDRQWQGTVQLSLGDISLPVDIGRIEPGQTATDEVDLTLANGSYDISGTLLIGP